MDGARIITTLMGKDQLSNARVYRDLGDREAARFTEQSQIASILEDTVSGVGQRTPRSSSPQHSVRGRLTEREHDIGEADDPTHLRQGDW
jgi:hypothetical protein